MMKGIATIICESVHYESLPASASSIDLHCEISCMISDREHAVLVKVEEMRSAGSGLDDAGCEHKRRKSWNERE